MISQIFIMCTLSTWSEFAVVDESGDKFNVRLGEGGMMVITILKIITNILFIKWGVMALKTFKPIVKDLHR